MDDGEGELPNLAGLDQFVRVEEKYAYPRYGGTGRIGPLFVLHLAAIRYVYNKMQRRSDSSNLDHNEMMARAALKLHKMKFANIVFYMPSAEYGGEHGFESTEGNYVIANEQ